MNFRLPSPFRADQVVASPQRTWRAVFRCAAGDLIVLLSFLYALAAQSAPHAMVVSAHPEATKVGLDVLKRHGNAADAAIAVQFALAVVYPEAGNIGGGGFFVWRSAKEEALCLDFRERAPQLASRDMFLDSSGQVIRERSLVGGLASGVPGSVDGMVRIHQRLGSLPWKDLVQPAIELARQGFRITKHQADDLNAFAQQLARWNDSSCALLRKLPWKAGDLLIQPELATTLEAIRDEGRDGFYRGECAESVLESMRTHGGLITQRDLDAYQAQWRHVLSGQFRGYEVITMPPPSSGGVALLQLLSMWQQHGKTPPPYHSAAHCHLAVECERRVYADRSEWLGDPDFGSLPITRLLDSAYLAGRMSDYRTDSATLSSLVHPGMAMPKESDQTTHFSIVDEYGNAVALTTTLNASFGSKLMVKGAGFLLNNEMDDFSAKPGSPNMYGLTGSSRNSVVPGKRMLSSMTPTILSRDHKLFMVVGTPGGGTIITSVFQSILNVIDYHFNAQKAVSAPRFHHQWLPDVVDIEEGCVDKTTRLRLRKMGHVLEDHRPMGRVDAIVIGTDGHMHGGADPRGDDCVGAF